MILTRLLLLIFLSGAGFYAFLCAFLYFQQERMIFPGGFSGKLHCPYFEEDGFKFLANRQEVKKPSKALLMFHGNGGNACDRMDVLQELSSLKRDIFVFNYPGFGDPGTKPTTALIKERSLQFFDFIKNDYEEVALFGESLGTLFSTYVASQRYVEQLVLQSPFPSVEAVARHFYPFFPIRLLLKDSLPAENWASSIDRPALIILGDRDRTIPPHLSEGFIKSYRGVTEVYRVRGGDHNTLRSPQYWERIRDFLQR